ncbi:metallophosphoesterase family protein [Marinitoga lauensis]|uniref:metallophosphoesterase family protein n=1 Tax=Marinitoga lauensis TaxID=2201189 RepID=UPI001010235C|nr:metallophosphoesterase family protein [Marinitoga lauensis]
MKLGVLSDTHGSLFYFEKALKYLKDVDRIIHLGDYLYHGLEILFQKDIILWNYPIY